MRLRLILSYCLLLLLALLVAFGTSSRAYSSEHEWFWPAHSSKDMVNADLTPSRAMSAHCKKSWEGQLVLWEGRVIKHVLFHGLDRIELATAAGPVSVVFSRAARNLEYDRTGFRIAIKGYLHLQQGCFSYLEGQSVILLEPPTAYKYSTWLCGEQPSLASFIAWRIGFHNPEAPYEQNQAIAEALVTSCSQVGLDPLFLASLIQIESAWDVDAVSVSGATGLGQLMPATAQGLGVTDASDPVENIRGSSVMVARILKEWQDSSNPRATVLASYNAGPNRVRRLKGQVPNIPETTNYVYFIGYVNRDINRLVQENHLH